MLGPRNLPQDADGTPTSARYARERGVLWPGIIASRRFLGKYTLPACIPRSPRRLITRPDEIPYAVALANACMSKLALAFITHTIPHSELVKCRSARLPVTAHPYSHSTFLATTISSVTVLLLLPAVITVATVAITTTTACRSFCPFWIVCDTCLSGSFLRSLRVRMSPSLGNRCSLHPNWRFVVRTTLLPLYSYLSQPHL